MSKLREDFDDSDTCSWVSHCLCSRCKVCWWFGMFWWSSLAYFFKAQLFISWICHLTCKHKLFNHVFTPWSTTHVSY
jgi:hypothetical protein